MLPGERASGASLAPAGAGQRRDHFYHYSNDDTAAKLTMRAIRPGPAAWRHLSLVVPAMLCACNRGPDPATLAGQGRIDPAAPIHAEITVLIAASPPAIWQILSDVAAWPGWQRDIESTRITGPPAVGSSFTWSTGGMTISSRLRLFQKDRAIAWTGQVFTLHAIHVFTLNPLPDGRTEVTTQESMAGLAATLLYSSQALAQSDAGWLASLKAKAERHQAASSPGAAPPDHPAAP